MLTFEKTLIIVMIVTFSGNINANYEGSTCNLPGGKLGVCTKLPECKSIDNGLRANTIPFKSIVQCSFIGNTLVICCPDRAPTQNVHKNPHTHTSGGIVFEATTTASNTFNNWNQGNFNNNNDETKNNRNINVRDRESKESSEENFNYQPTTLKSTINDPWAAYEFRPAATSTQATFPNWIQSSTEKSRELPEEQFQGSAKSSFLFPSSGSLGAHNHHNFNQQNNNADMESTTKSARREEFNNNNNLDPWMKEALNSQINQQNIHSNTHNHNIFNPQNNNDVESTNNYPRREEFNNNNNNNNNNLDSWMKDALNSGKNQENIQSNTHSHHSLNPPNNNDVESTNNSPRREEFNNNNNLDPWMQNALNPGSNPNTNKNFENSDNWKWHTTTSTTTQTPYINSWSTPNQNFGQQDSSSSSNFNNFNEISSFHPNNNIENNFAPTTTSPTLDFWMIDAIQSSQLTSSSTTAKPFTFSDNKKPVWESKSELDGGDIYTTAVTRGTARKSISACERYRKNLGPRLDFHIIDGEPTKPGEFPHMAGLGYREFDTDEYTWDCGGSLISDSFILTAAHCCDNPKRQPKLIRLGKTTIRNNDDGAEAVDVQISKITIHPEYRSFAKYNDIALIKLSKAVAFNNDVSPACLYTDKKDMPESEILVATGWGVNNVEKRTESNFLLKVNLTSNPLNACNQSYFEYGFTRQYSSGLNSGQMCAYDRKFDKDSCQGDSGGPLQLVDDTLHLSTIVGVTSFGIGCASAIPSVYTRVAYFMDWIESIVWP